MSDWQPSSKYEVAPGLFIGSEIGDIDREIKVLIRKMLNGDENAIKEITRLTDRRIELMKPKRLRNDTT
jgi:hypothetical protein